MDAESRAAVFKRWIKFISVGAGGVGVQLVLLGFLSNAIGLNYLAATLISVEAAILHNFIWHLRWTWRDRGATFNAQSRALVRLVQFNITTGGISLVGNLVLMWALVGELGFSVIVANLSAIAVCGLVNFLVSDRWIFEMR